MKSIILNSDENNIIRGIKVFDEKGKVTDSMKAIFNELLPAGKLDPMNFGYKVGDKPNIVHFGDSHDTAALMKMSAYKNANKPSLHLTKIPDHEFNNHEFKIPEGSRVKSEEFDKAISDSAKVIYELMDKSREPGTGLTSKSSPFPTVNKGGKGLQA